MKRIFNMTALVLVLVLGSSLRQTASAQYYDDRGEVTYQTFYDELSPYGQWIEYPEHGYVWVPDAGPDFRPYSTNGHWVWTDDYEWMWVSDYDWGWAPFHYGRWFEDDYYGWVWVPGYEWSPAWVAWRDGGDYYGWAPLRPGINISINFNIGSYSPPYSYWNFAPRRYLAYRNIGSYCIDWRRNVTIINQTVIINNYSYSRNVFRTGPRRYDAERYIGRINPVRFRDTYTPGRTFYRNNEVSVYRPNIRRDDNRNFTPRQFDRYDRRNVDTRNGRSDNGFRRNDNANRRNNNQPVRRDFERRDDNTVRQPRDNNNGGRRFDRNDNTTRTPNPNDRVNNRVINRNTERPDRNVYQNPGNNGNDRRFERPNNNRNYSPSTREPRVRETNNGGYQRPPRQQMERREETRQQPNRQFERRENGNRSGNQPGGGNNGNRGRSRF